MSERMTDRSVEQALTAWMDDMAPDRPPTRLLEETFARTTGAEQERAYPWHRHSNARAGLLALMALVVLALGVGLFAGGARFSSPRSPLPSPSPSVATRPSASTTASSLPSAIAVTPEAVIPVQNPLTMVPLGSVIWTLGAGEVERIDPSTNTVTGSVTLGGAADLYNDLAANDAGLWATDWDNATLYRVNPLTLKVVARIPIGFAKGILADADGVWVAQTHDGKVLRIDPATNTVVATITVGPAGNSGPNWLARGLGSIWVNIPNNSTVVRIDPVTNAIQATINIPSNVTPCGGYEFQATAVWITPCGGETSVAVIDPVTNTVIGTEVHVPFGAIPTTISGGLWVNLENGKADGGTLVRVDSARTKIDRVLAPTQPFGAGGAMLVLAGSVWAIDAYNDAVLRLPLAAFAP